MPPVEFPRPDGLVRVEVCADSGLLPGESRPGMPLATIGDLVVFSCPHRRYEWFIAGTEPTEVDRSHVRVRETDPRSGRVDWRETWLLPAEYTEWARAEGIWQPVAGRSIDAVAAPQNVPESADLLLVSPEPNRRYRLDASTPLAAQRVPVTVRPASTLLATGAGVAILIDGVQQAVATAPEFTYWWQLEPGRHTFEAVAQVSSGGKTSSPSIEVFVE